MTLRIMKVGELEKGEEPRRRIAVAVEADEQYSVDVLHASAHMWPDRPIYTRPMSQEELKERPLGDARLYTGNILAVVLEQTGLRLECDVWKWGALRAHVGQRMGFGVLVIGHWEKDADGKERQIMGEIREVQSINFIGEEFCECPSDGVGSTGTLPPASNGICDACLLKRPSAFEWKLSGKTTTLTEALKEIKEEKASAVALQLHLGALKDVADSAAECVESMRRLVEAKERGELHPGVAKTIASTVAAEAGIAIPEYPVGDGPVSVIMDLGPGDTAYRKLLFGPSKEVRFSGEGRNIPPMFSAPKPLLDYSAVTPIVTSPAMREALMRDANLERSSGDGGATMQSITISGPLAAKAAEESKRAGHDVEPLGDGSYRIVLPKTDAKWLGYSAVKPPMEKRAESSPKCVLCDKLPSEHDQWSEHPFCVNPPAAWEHATKPHDLLRFYPREYTRGLAGDLAYMLPDGHPSKTSVISWTERTVVYVVSVYDIRGLLEQLQSNAMVTREEEMLRRGIYSDSEHFCEQVKEARAEMDARICAVLRKHGERA